ncbi:dihydrofolate reductase family protein [Paenibacillus koleovorans]|uniref:dihydrofolate reductase family protein n=1 Tax=Paenibacillus koleovorans TaxID=121608 RepID=UPI000FD6C451|nr:dihydrofolate reductase family protein [Paenibacillus koleovorans]
MRKVVVFLHQSLDGIVEGPNGPMDIGWVSYDDQLALHAQEILSTVDTIVWGRNTYLVMYAYWPTVPSNPMAPKHAVEHAHWVEAVQKVVFSTTLEQADWNNTRLERGNLVEVITELKNQPGNDIMVLGSPRLAHTMMQLGLVDVFKMTISPVVLGKGLPYFQSIDSQINLRLTRHQIFPSGVISAVYEKTAK